MTTNSNGDGEGVLTMAHVKAAMDKVKALPPALPPVIIIENARLLVHDGEDWSKVRSPGRARRRRRQGHRQNIIQKWKPDPTIYQVEGRCYMHPSIAVQLRAKIAAQGLPDNSIANLRFPY